MEDTDPASEEIRRRRPLGTSVQAPHGSGFERIGFGTYNDCNEVVMKRVIFAVLLTALALFLLVPSLSWAF
jgi:hypothetical protein